MDKLNKRQMLVKLKEMQADLHLSREDFVANMNKRFSDSKYEIKVDDYFPYMVGRLQADIEYLIENS